MWCFLRSYFYQAFIYLSRESHSTDLTGWNLTWNSGWLPAPSDQSASASRHWRCAPPRPALFLDFNCVCLCVSIRGYGQVRAGACQVPWSWSYRPLYAVTPQSTLLIVGVQWHLGALQERYVL